METTTKRQALIKAINEQLELAYDDTLQEILSLLKIRKQEDESDERDFEEGLKDIVENGTLTWSEHQQKTA
ncbi:hypothetical protein CDG76_35060 [Nostoc sp. 'Peltigera membranacea cyanobiont' 210A]|uniref:hypothetical protein n=1 Tax=Nostoc sp. 'Peltigera membranacea cyanobiont' 210A TaxID=2014529 RepID=UPI000B95C548|nr:hypothetical protein [Nostoc sp. 'Peltigera membranacea cyanobiont' 210A]OYD89485.1 hypothetical protein CDG76_35060 [Nostoc sp. 'Peltigera membranacea cyanobiont' 210A]